MDKDLVPVERKLTAERTTKLYMMRKSEAAIRANLTPRMEDAWNEIERAFRLIAGHMGYGNHDLNHVKGQTEADQEWVIDQVNKYRQWAKDCDDKWRGVVIDMTAFNFSPDEVAFQRSITKETVMIRFRQGLNVWCINRGWGDQIEKK